MATLGNDRSGRYIQFENRDGQRKTLRLGKIPKRDAESIRFHVKAIVTAQVTGGVPDAKTARWLAEASERMRERLAKAGLVENRHRAMLGPFIDEYVASRVDVAKSTKLLWKTAHESLRFYFGESKPLRAITKGGRQGVAGVNRTRPRGEYGAEADGGRQVVIQRGGRPPAY